MAEEQKTTTTQQQTIAQNDFDQKFISINEFFDFMNLSCCLNDMINNGRNLANKNSNNGSSNTASGSAQQTSGNSKNRKNGAFLNNLQNQQQQQQNKERLTHVANTTSTARRTQFEIDFKKLAENPLINNLYGFAKNRQQQMQTQQQQTQEDANEQKKSKSNKQQPQINGLHPSLSEKLNYVINEGILDAVLPFICPVSMSSAPCTTTRANKTKHANNNNNNNYQATNPLVHTDSRQSCSTISLPLNCSALESSCHSTDTMNNAEVSASGVCTKLSFVANATGRRKSLSNSKTICNSIPKE